jgi:excisionase family DNA binding protein
MLPDWIYEPPAPVKSSAATTATSPSQDLLLTVPEVAAILRLSTRTISRLINRGELRAVRIGRAIRIRKDDISTIFNKNSNSSITWPFLVNTYHI